MEKYKCKITGETLVPVVDFGNQPLGNGFLEASDFEKEYFFNMEVGFGEKSMMLQLLEQPEAEKMFHAQYAFYSSTSSFMTQHFKLFAEQVMESGFIEKKDPFIIELGCNDGIMLKNFADRKIRHLGIEPSVNVAREANKKGVSTCSEFFNEDLAERIVKEHGQADAFLAANVMCHIPDIVGVVKGIKKLIKPSGIVMFEDPYLGDIIKKTSYDQIYDEHVYFFSALSVQYLFALNGMDLIDVLPQKTHGGSMRYVCAHQGAYPIAESVKITLEKERNQGLDCIDTFHDFRLKVENSKKQLVDLLNRLKADGKSVAGYAATSKSTTILNYCGIGTELIKYISDTTPIKQGKFSPGMHIPVVSYETFKENPPDYAFLFAWNHAEEIMAKEKDFIASGGKWIVHVPEVRVIG